MEMEIVMRANGSMIREVDKASSICKMEIDLLESSRRMIKAVEGYITS